MFGGRCDLHQLQLCKLKWEFFLKNCTVTKIFGVTTIYIVIFSMLLKTGCRFNSFKILMLNIILSDMQINLSYLLLWLLCIDRQGHIQIF